MKLTPEPQSIAEQIYRAYPRRIGYRVALQAIEKALKAVHGDHEWLLERVKAYSRSVQGKETRFVPHPSTWFNQERYMDDIEEQRIGGGRELTPFELAEQDRQRRRGTG